MSKYFVYLSYFVLLAIIGYSTYDVYVDLKNLKYDCLCTVDSLTVDNNLRVVCFSSFESGQVVRYNRRILPLEMYSTTLVGQKIRLHCDDVKKTVYFKSEKLPNNRTLIYNFSIFLFLCSAFVFTVISDYKKLK